MSKPWGAIGAWAAESERAEAEELEAASAVPTPEPQSFPSLKEAVNSKQKKKKMSLSEFNTGYNVGGGYGGAKTTDYEKLTPEEMMRLPTRPKERSAEEMQYGRLGGGFPSYGRVGQGPNRGMRDRDDGDGSWGTGRRSYGGFDEERRGPNSRASEDGQPSRADEVDNWAMAKKSAPALDAGRQNRYGGLGAGGGMSRADEVDNWGAGKKPMQTRSSTFGSGFRSSGPEPDRWARGGGDGGGFREERPRLILNPPSGDVQESALKTDKPNPFGLARPREEVLAEKGLDWKRLESDIDAKKTSRPTSSQSSRPSSAQSSRSEGVQQHGMENVVKPRSKVNPFGDAKPREVLLEERGKDWRKIDLELEHRRIDRPETEDEKTLKEEIDHLKKEIEKATTSKADRDVIHEAGGSPSSLVSILHQKERELVMLIRDFDDKVRFGQRAAEKLVSGTGRANSFPDRPLSRPGSTEGSRSIDFGERPRSRGTSDSWSRHGDERRAFQGARERGFLGNRDLDRTDRPRSRERW